jgi:hypothetical protein
MVSAFNGSSVPAITHILRVPLQVGRHWQPECTFYITDLGRNNIILGIGWLKEHGCILNPVTSEPLFLGNHCQHKGAPPILPFPNLTAALSSPPTTPDLEDQPNATDSDYVTTPEEQISSDAKGSDQPRRRKNTQRATRNRNAQLRKQERLRLQLRGPASSVRCTLPKFLDDAEEAAFYYQDFEYVDPEPKVDHVPEITMISAYAVKTLAKRGGIQICAISMRDIIDQHQKEETEPDPDSIEKLLPPELKTFAKVFSKQDADTLPPLRGDADHSIHLNPGSMPDWIPHLYRMSREELEEVRRWVQENLSKGFIEASQAPWASPILFVKKPGGGIRLCHDYRKLNAISKKDRYPLPLIDDIMTLIGGSTIMTRLDIRHAFNRIRINPDNEDLTTFSTPMGNYKQKVLPFGLCGGPATFQRFINNTLIDYLNVFCAAYMDDVLIFSRNREEHIKHVKMVLQKLQDAGLQVDIRKSEFFVTQTKFLGLIISKDGLSMDPEKVQVIKDWKKPTNLTEVQSFVGFCNFYRRFIKNFSKVLKPMIELSKKELKHQFEWTDSQQVAFQQMKDLVTSAPVLAHFDHSKTSYVEVDSADYVHGGILSQEDANGVLHPVAFFSRKLTPAECNYEIYDKELLAIISAFEHWRPELEGTELPIKVLTDHKALEYFMSTKKLTRRQARWALELSNYNFEITYRPGKANGKADALTRKAGDRPADDTDERQKYQFQTLLEPSRLHPNILADLQARANELDTDDLGDEPISTLLAPILEAEADDEEVLDFLEDRIRRVQPLDKTYQRIKKKIENGERHDKELTLADCEIKEEALFVQGKLWVPESIRTETITAVHDTPVTGHPGLAKTLYHLKKSYYWINMHKDVQQFLRNCHPCRRVKPFRDKYHGSLQPLPVVDQPWRHISMDLIVKLPRTIKGYDSIAVIVCRLTKRRLFFPINEKGFDAATCARLVYLQMRRLGVGIIASFVSDRGVQWDNEFWKHLCRLWKIKKLMSTSHHPETDGQTEIANQELERYLRTFCSYQQDDWDEWLIEAEAAINGHPSESTQISPFFATNGYEPMNPFDLRIEEPLPKISTKGKKDRERALRFAEDTAARAQFCKEQITLAQSRMAEHANKHRKPAPLYKPGDKVWLSLRNFTTQRPTKKLDDRNVRCEIEKRIGSSYRLKLPPGMAATRTNRTFHTSLLRLDPEDPLPQQHNDPQPPVYIQDEDEDEAHAEWEVEEIVDSHMAPYGRLEYRVKWANQPPDHVWYPAKNFKNAPEAVEAFHSKYPNKPRSLRIKQKELDTRKEKRDKAHWDAMLRTRARTRSQVRPD